MESTKGFLAAFAILRGSQSHFVRSMLSASEFERAMRAKDHSGMLDRLFTTVLSAGKMLMELVRVVPARVEKRKWGGLAHYRIFPLKKS